MKQKQQHMDKYFYNEWQTKLIETHFPDIKNIKSIAIFNNKRNPTQTLPFDYFAKVLRDLSFATEITIITKGRDSGMFYYSHPILEQMRIIFFKNAMVIDEISHENFEKYNYYNVCENYAETKTMQINLLTICENMNDFANYDTDTPWTHVERIFADIFLVRMIGNY
jgi:hypothetical protein